MIPSRKAWASGTAGFLALLCVVGCITPSSRPPLSVDTQAEALSHFSMGLLAVASDDSVAALEHLEAAIDLDPCAATLYPPAVALALKVNRPEEALRLARQLRKKQPQTVDPLLLLARVTAMAGQLVDAETLFTQSLSEFPERPETHLSTARFYLSQERYSEAIQTLESALVEHGGNVDLLQLLGSLIIEKSSNSATPPSTDQNILKGVRLLETALEIDGSDPKRWQQVGYAYLSIQQLEKALVSLENARKNSPEDIDLARQIMELSIQTGAYDHALELSENLPEETETDPEAWLQYLIEKTPPEHRERLTEYLKDKLQQKNPPLFYYTQLGSLYLDGKHYAKATACLLEALPIYPNDGRLRTVLGYLHLQEKKYDEAYTAFDHVRTHSPHTEWAQNPFFSFNFMIAAQKSDHLKEAVATLASTYTNDPVVLNQYMHSLLTGQSPVSTRAAINLLESFHQLSPEAVEALYYLTLLQAEEEEYEAALRNAQRFEQLAKDQGKTNLLDGFFYYQYATLHERIGQFANAENYFFKAIELGDQATIASAQNYLAYMWAERGKKLKFGLSLIEEALATEPDNAAFIDTLGWIYYMQGRYEEALVQLKTASELFGKDSTIWEHLGDTYLKLGNPTAALEHWGKALDLSPEAEYLNQRIKENTP